MSALSAAASDEDGDIIQNLQARVADLESQLYAVGAGGVGNMEQPQCVDWPEVDRLLKTVKYLIGIAERGSGRKMRNDDETVEQFVLSYVRSLEQPQGEQKPNSKWPSNASEVRAFLSGRVATERYARDDHQPDDNDTYTLSAHDLLEAIDWWTDFDPQSRQPLTEEEIAYCIFEARLGAEGAFKRNGSSSYRIARAIERAHGIGGAA